MLTLERLHVYIEASHILKDMALSVGERECVCVIGRNGAGKTTLRRIAWTWAGRQWTTSSPREVRGGTPYQ
jgi:ABC-type branched-subunit amino acid transport system ATPase component